jgi:hypothetical protein
MFLNGEPWALTDVETQVLGHAIGIPEVLQTPEVRGAQLAGAFCWSHVVVRQAAEAYAGTPSNAARMNVLPDFMREHPNIDDRTNTSNVHGMLLET